MAKQREFNLPPNFDANGFFIMYIKTAREAYCL